jgi:hypothetical protein
LKLFQIEEPDGSPADPDLPGAALGIDIGGAEAVVGFSVGGNAVVLSDRDGFEEALPVPAPDAPAVLWQTLFEGVRLRAERALARPATHAVIAVTEETHENSLRQGAKAAGLEILRVGRLGDALAAAVLAEDLAPRPEPPAFPDTR